MPHSVTLKAGYTQKDLFYAAIEVQLERFKNNPEGARILESPRIEESDDGSLVLHSSKHSLENVNNFKNSIATAAACQEWNEIRAKSPLQLDAQQEWSVVDIEAFDNYQFVNYLSDFIEQFKRDIVPFFSERADLIKKLELENNSDLILSIAVVLCHVLAPSLGGKLKDTDETKVVYGFFNRVMNIAANKLLMKPEPKGNVDSCCEAMLNLAGLWLRQPVGEEARNLLGKKPNGQPGEYTPAMFMRDLTEGNNLAPEVIDQLISNVSIPDGPYVTHNQYALLQEKCNDDRVFLHFYACYLGLIRQLDKSRCRPAIYTNSLQRAWDDFIQNKNCPQWLVDKNNVLRDKVVSESALRQFQVLNALPKFFSNITKRIQQCDHYDPNALENEIFSLIEQALITLVGEFKIAFPDLQALSLTQGVEEDFSKRNAEIIKLMAFQLSGLVNLYTKEKSLNGQICSFVATKAERFLNSFSISVSTKKDLYSDLEASIKNIFLLEKEKLCETLAIHLDMESQTPCVSSILESALFRSLDELFPLKMIKSLLELKGSIPDDLFDEHVEKQWNKLSGISVGYLTERQVIQLFGDIKKLHLEVQKSSLESMLIKLWVKLAAQKNTFKASYAMMALNTSMDMFIDMLEAAHNSVENIIAAISSSEAFFQAFSQAITFEEKTVADRLRISRNGSYLKKLAKIFESGTVLVSSSEAKENLIHAKEAYAASQLAILDNPKENSINSSLEIYPHKFVENFLIDELHAFNDFPSKNLMLAILQCNLPLESKLRYIGAISQGKFHRNVTRAGTTVRLLYESMTCFCKVKSKKDILPIFLEHLKKRKIVSEEVLNLDSYYQRQSILDAQLKNTSLPKKQQLSFEKLFMRWVNFSVITGEALKQEDLNFKITLTKEEMQSCREAIKADQHLSVLQTQEFIDILDECGARAQLKSLAEELKKCTCEITSGYGMFKAVMFPSEIQKVVNIIESTQLPAVDILTQISEMKLVTNENNSPKNVAIRSANDALEKFRAPMVGSASPVSVMEI